MHKPLVLWCACRWAALGHAEGSVCDVLEKIIDRRAQWRPVALVNTLPQSELEPSAVLTDLEPVHCHVICHSPWPALVDESQ